MNKLNILDDILFNGLQPWLPMNHPDEKYESMLSDIKAVEPTNPMKYKVEFYRPFNFKTKYYHKLIIRETNKYCDRVINLISVDENLQVKKFLLNDTLNKKLKSRLIEVGKLIKEKHLDIDYIDPTKFTFEQDVDHRTTIYIIQLLKCCLIKIYLEIENAFPIFRKDRMVIEDFYTQLLFEPIPSNSFLKETPHILIIEPIKIKGVKATSSLIKQSFNSFTYNNLSKGSEKLTDLWDSLKKFHFIAEDTPLISFKKVFTGKELLHPVVWTGNSSEFYYFIYLIYSRYKLVEGLRQQQWQVACKCFIPNNESTYDPSKIRRLKKPQLTASSVEQAVNLLK